MTFVRLVLKRLYRSFYRPRQRLNVAVIEKEKALTAKALAETRATQIESVRKNIAAFGFAYGLIVVFCYCFFDIKFFPSGLSTGDVLFFLFAALGLGLMSVVCSALGMSLFAPAWFFDDCLPKAGAAKADEAFGDGLWFLCPAAVVGAVALTTINWWCGLVAWLLLLAIFFFISRKGLGLRRMRGARADWTDAIPHATYYLLIAPLVCYLLIALGNPGWGVLGVIVIGGMAGTFGISLLNNQTLAIPANPAEREKHAKRRLVTQVLFIIALLPALIVQPLRISVFTQLGVRAEDMAISVDKVNLALLQSAADTAGVPLSICRGEEGQATVAPIDVLWHASGTRSMVHLGPGEGIDVELNTSTLRLVRGKVERCLEINESLLFGSGTANLLGGEKHVQEALTREFVPLLSEIKQKWRIKSVKIVGHADPMPLPADGNDALALKRAEIVKELLLKNPEFAKASAGAPTPAATSDGARHPIKQCDSKEPLPYQRSCNEVNRRVEVRLRLERAPKPK